MGCAGAYKTNMPRPTIAFQNQPDWAKLRVLKWIVPLVLLAILAFTMYYTVPADSEGVVLRFGRFSSTTPSGLHFKLPFGVELATIVPTKRQLKQEFGFATAGATDPYQRRDPVDAKRETRMVQSRSPSTSSRARCRPTRPSSRRTRPWCSPPTAISSSS